MNEDSQRNALLFSGALLVFVGFLSGATIPAMASARLGLSAHLGGVQGGMLLMIVGLVWKHVQLSPRLESSAFVTAIFSNYALFIALQLAAIWGTSRSTPIAGAGMGGSPLQEAVVDGVLYAASFAAFVAMGLVVWGLRPGASGSEGNPGRA